MRKPPSGCWLNIPHTIDPQRKPKAFRTIDETHSHGTHRAEDVSLKGNDLFDPDSQAPEFSKDFNCRPVDAVAVLLKTAN